MSSSKNTLVILALSIMLPILVFTGIELSTLNEDEEMLEEIYLQQIDAVIFSLNQYAEDYVRSFGNDIAGEWSRSSGNALISEDLRANNLALVGVGLFRSERSYLEMVDSSSQVLSISRLDSIFNANLITCERLIQYAEANYRKLEPIGQIRLADGTKANIILSILDDGIPMVLLVDGKLFVEDLFNPRLQQVANQNLLISIKDVHDNTQLVSTDQAEAQSVRSAVLWLLPEFELSVSIIGESVEELINYRRKKNIIALSLLVSFFMLGGFLMIRTLRREMQLSKAKSDFVANVSHEIRTPLSLISMFNETLMLGRVPNEAKKQEYYEIIDKETTRLKNIVNKILSFSQIEANKRTYDFQEVSANDLVEDIVSSYSYHLEREGFEVHIGLTKLPAHIRADKEAFSEALVNLIDNSVKYSGTTKWIEIQSVVEHGQYVLTVRDKGRGIPADQLPFIFDQFYRVRSDDNFEAKGTGLGLSLVKAIMEVHEGRVEATSTLGEGSEFRLYYPMTNHE